MQVQVIINSGPIIKSTSSSAGGLSGTYNASAAQQMETASIFQPDEVSIGESQNLIFTSFGYTTAIRSDDIVWGDLTRREYLDISKSLREKVDGTDFSAMTNAEKYQYIYDLYSEAYGTDSDPYAENGVEMLDAFQGAKVRIFTDSWKTKYAANRSRLYGDMSTDAIVESVAARYPSSNKITFDELSRMARELQDVGVGGRELPQIISDYQEIMESNGVADFGTLPVQWQLMVEQYGVHNGSASFASQPWRGLAMMEAGIAISKMVGRDITGYETVAGSSNINIADLIHNAVARMSRSYEDYADGMEETKNALDEFWDKIFDKKDER
jgi:hypothetical protein